MLLEQTRLGKKYKNIVRYKRIISVLLKHGFNDFVEHSKLLHNLHPKDQRRLTQPKDKKHHHNHPQKHSPRPHVPLTHWVRIRLVLEELGPTFIKLGQFVSNRPDLIPDELCEELQKLLDHVPPFANDTAVEILEKSLKTDIKSVFKKFDEQPFSSASIAQVHEGFLKDGTKVAVKIQRPGIKSIIHSDLEIMFHIAGLIKKHVKGADVINPVSIVEEFKDGILSEIDFENEARNLEKFKRLFSKNSIIVIPSTYKKYVSEHVLVMDYIEGTNLSDISPKKPPEGIVLTKITSNIAKLVLKQIFEKGYFHADPHSGNIIICEDNKICFIDFGLMGILPPKHKNYLCQMIYGLVDNDADHITRAVLKLSLNKEVENRAGLENEIFKIIEAYIHLPLEDINISHFLRDIIGVIVRNKLTLPSNIYILLKSLISLEGTVRKYEPGFNMLAHIEPFVKRMMYEDSSPRKMIKELYVSGFNYIRLIKDLPIEIRDIFELVKNKTLKIQFEIRGMEPMLEKHDQIVNRLSFSIITASMLIGSALLLKARIPPMIGHVSLIGGVTFLFSLFMGCLLLISILRHGKM